jgi:hypothetical protein
MPGKNIVKAVVLSVVVFLLADAAAILRHLADEGAPPL